MRRPDRQEQHDDVRCVLVVDDHHDTTEAFSMIFHLLGYQTSTAELGRDAVRVAHEVAPQLILLDICLPDVSGYDVVSALRADQRVADAFMVALTGWGRPEDMTRALEAGFDARFIKPIGLPTIREILRSASLHARRRDPASTPTSGTIDGA